MLRNSISGLADLSTPAPHPTITLSQSINILASADATDLLQGSVVGKALEAGGNAEVVAIRINL